MNHPCPKEELPEPATVTIDMGDQTEITYDFTQFTRNVLACLAIKKGIFDIQFVNEVAIKEMHKTHLNSHAVTDIITFNLGTNKEPIADIYICFAQAKKQAGEHRVTVLNELKRLIIHGVLHCVGYDDKDKKDQTIMFQKQEAILQTCCKEGVNE